MAGSKETKEALNDTLLFIIKLLKEHQIDSWFIGYGTLLGMIRENSCIHGDDDVDIIIHKKHYDALKSILVNNGFILALSKSGIIKTKRKNNFASIDFYMASVDMNGNFYDSWEKVTWSKCYDENGQLIERKWNDEILYIPFNSEEKLRNRYGSTWRIPKNQKGVDRKKIL